MAKREIGIRKNAYQAIISGCRVAYDPRGTQEADETRDPKNYKADEQWLRKQLWEQRQREQRKQAAE